MPYIYSTSWEVTNAQSSFLRALVMDFPQDKNVWDINNEYMFGKSILVAPIVEAQYTDEKNVETNEQDGWNKAVRNVDDGGATTDFTQKKSSNVYLPAGAAWYDFWTKQKHAGGQHIDVQTSIDMIPLYIKAGSIVPLGQKVQYANEKSWDSLELHVFPGENGSFLLYEDEFDNYNYQEGLYTEIPIHWNDSARKLTIDARRGRYDGAIEQRSFTLVLPGGKTQTVQYDGKKTVVKL